MYRWISAAIRPRGEFMTLLQWGLLILGVIMSAAGSFFLKLGAVDVQHDATFFEIATQIAFNWKILTGVFMYFVPVLIWIFLLKKIELSFLQPLFAMVYIITPVLAGLLLHEQVSSQRWFGIGVIFIGVFIVART
jgi:uncharacterized membrane protein